MCNAKAIAAMAGANMLLAHSEYKATKRFAEAEAQQQREQIKDERMALAIETAEAQNTLNQQFQENLAANRALLASTGTTEQSGSYQALLASNKGEVKKDLRNVGLESLTKARDISYAATDIEMSLAATKYKAKQKFIGSVIDTGMTAGMAIEGMGGLGGGSKGQQVGRKSQNFKYYSKSDKKRFLGE